MSDPSLLIRGGRLIDGRGLDTITDVRIDDGRITAVGDAASAGPGGERETPELTVLDAAGMLVLPGLCDMHVHFREPGFEYKETVATGAQAAVAGGFTDVACMPNTEPPIDDRATVWLVRERALAAAACRVHPIAAVTVGMRGEDLTQMAELREAGAVGFSDDGLPVRSAEIMRRALEYSLMVDAPIIDHCEDPALSAGGVMHEGVMSTRLGLRGIPAASEEVMVARDLRLAALTGGRLHLAHVSTAGSVGLIRAAKAEGLPVTAEVTPHHLVLTDEAVHTYDPVMKVNPPLRTAADVAAVRAALADGTLDAIATDHAPHSIDEKELEFDRAPFGLIGVETALGLVLTELVEAGVIDLQRLVATMSLAPRRILGLPEPRFEAGSPADLTVVDPGRCWTVDPARLRSRSRNTPYAGRELRGWVGWTIVGGRVAYTAAPAPVG